MQAIQPSAAVVVRHMCRTDTKPARLCVEIRDFPRRYYDRLRIEIDAGRGSSVAGEMTQYQTAAEKRIAELVLDWELTAHTIVNDSHIFTTRQRSTKPRRFVYSYYTKTGHNNPTVHTVELYEVIDGMPLLPQGRKIDTFTGEHQILMELMEERKLLPDLGLKYDNGMPRRPHMVDLQERGIFIERV